MVGAVGFLMMLPRAPGWGLRWTGRRLLGGGLTTPRQTLSPMRCLPPNQAHWSTASVGEERFAPFSTVFSLPFHGGLCLGVQLPDALADTALPPELHEEEVAFASDLSQIRAAEFLGGRVAIRRAMGAKLAETVGPIHRSSRGAPVLSNGIRGSISHKRHVAVALVQTGPCSPVGGRIGVDIEDLHPTRYKGRLAQRVLLEEEVDKLGSLESTGLTKDQEVLLAFSFKEAVYKAIDPFLERFVSFQEVVASFSPDGSCSARMVAPEFPSSTTESEPSLHITGSWVQVGRYAVTAATASIVEGDGG